MGRRDRAPKDKVSMKKEAFGEQVLGILDEIQTGLFQRALAHRQEHTRKINSLDELTEFFTPKSSKKPEIHGGFALVHWVDDPRVEVELKKRKLTHRCIPLDAEEEDGVCIFTGKPSKRRVIIAKAY